MTFVFAANNTSFVINKNGKVFAWGENFITLMKHRAKFQPIDIVFEIAPAKGAEDVKFKRILGSNHRYALVSFTDDLYMFGRK
jgi:hypothetical protein